VKGAGETDLQGGKKRGIGLGQGNRDGTAEGNGKRDSGGRRRQWQGKPEVAKPPE